MIHTHTVARLRVAFVACVALGIAGPQAQAQGTLQIDQDCAAVGCFPGDDPGFPVSITVAGHYKLVGSLTVAADYAGTAAVFLNVQDGEVHLDLNGFQIRGPFACAATPVAGCTQGANTTNGITFLVRSGSLRNGTVRGFGGAGMHGATRDGFSIDNVAMVENAAGGVRLHAGPYSRAFTVRDSRFYRNGGHGFSDAAGANGNARYERNHFYGNQLAGLSGQNASLIDNVFRLNGSLGFQAFGGGCMQTRNLFFENNGNGVQTSLGCPGANNYCHNAPC
jgi:hypothetical protein